MSKKKKVLLITIPIILLIIVGIGAGGYIYVNKSIYKPTQEANIFENKEKAQEAKYQEEQGIFNILLCGLDGRTKDSDSRTDSMILATIDTSKKSIKLVSFMRDMYVPIPNHGQSRLNTAFFLGGTELLMKTLNEDFNLNIQYFVTIDFKAFQSMVDKVGGIDLEVKDYEVKQLNYYIKEANWNNPDYIKQAGYQHLNGQQALSYCRIRKVGNNDYERTERQRRVISLLIAKARKLSIFKWPQFMSSALPYVKTNMSTSKIFNLGYTVMKFGTLAVDTARIPGDNMFQGMKINGADVLVPDMDKNVAYLDNFLSSNGSVGESNLPAYMANNFHINDIAIDKRNIKRNTVKIIIPKDSKKSQSLEPTDKDGPSFDTPLPSSSNEGNNDNKIEPKSNSNENNDVNDVPDANTNQNIDNNNDNVTTDSGIGTGE